jgi:hypothetical protein
MLSLLSTDKLEELGIQKQGKQSLSHHTSQKYSSSFLTFMIKEKNQKQMTIF